LPRPTPVNATSTSSSVSSGTSLTYAFTAVAGKPLIVDIGVGSGTTDPLLTGTTVTFNGVALTRLWSRNDGGWDSAGQFYLLNPSVGTFNIIITLSTTATVSSGANQWNDVDLSNGATSAFGTPVSNFSRADTNPTTGAIASDANSIVIGCAGSDCQTGQRVSGGGTETWHIDNINSDDGDGGQYNASGGSSISLTWTGQDAVNTGWACGGVSLHGTTATLPQQGRMAAQQRMG
jgi:hypothetical protein